MEKRIQSFFFSLSLSFSLLVLVHLLVHFPLLVLLLLPLSLSLVFSVSRGRLEKEREKNLFFFPSFLKNGSAKFFPLLLVLCVYVCTIDVSGWGVSSNHISEVQEQQSASAFRPWVHLRQIWQIRSMSER